MPDYESAKEVPVVAMLRIEADVHSGEIVLPDFGPTLLEKAKAGKSVVLEEGVALYDKTLLRVGRARNNDLILDIPNVSRFHALFTASLSGVVLNDLGSKNGTFVNGRRISMPVGLLSGDAVEIGPARLVIKLNFGAPLDDESRPQATEIDKMIAAGIVTVVVADVRNYTQLSEVLPAGDIAEMLNSWFDRVSEIILKYGGEVDKYIGDCVMALWRGAGAHANTFAANAVRAALEIREATRRLSASGFWRYHAKYPWECRLSLSTGSALMGSIGSRGLRDFTVLGDAVNVAFRLDKIGSQLGCDLVVNAETAEYVKEEFALKHLGPFDVKGKSEKVEVYTLA